MVLFRVFKCGLYRSLTMTKVVGNNSLLCFSAGIWKATGLQPCFFERRALTTNHDLSKDKIFLNGYEELPELQSAGENVQRIFSLPNASQKERRKVVHGELIKKCNNSQERKIAKMTVSITNLEDHVQRMKNKDKHNKVFLQWLKDQRTKKLRSLMMSNFERYIELIKELNIEPLKSTHSKYAKYKFRRFKIGVEIKEKKSQAVRKTPVLSKHTVL